MRDFRLVFLFELRETLRKKSLIITTAVLSILVFLAACIPMFMNLGSSVEEPIDDPIAEMLFVDAYYVFKNEEDFKILNQVLSIYPDMILNEDDDLQQMVLDGEVNAVIVVESLSSFKYITKDQSLTNSDALTFQALLQVINSNKILEDAGLDTLFIYNTINTPVTMETEILGKNSSLGIPIGMAIMFILYMVILLYGNGVSTSVAREKDSRTMELLITSTSTRDLILGKVFAAGLAGVLQSAIIILGAYLGFMISKGHYPEMILMLLEGQLSFDVIMVYLLFSVVGYILYLFVFAAMGSLVSKVEDVASVTTPITLLFVVAYMIATISFQNPNLKITTISSYIPFISIFTMPIRYMLTTVSFVEIGISVVIMIVTVYLLSILSIKIYRFGSLNYGNKLKLSTVLKGLRKE